MAKKVLIIEDDASMLEILSFKIKEAGFEVFEARDGEAGLELALREHPDLILLDLLLPKLSGLDLLKKLRKDKQSKQTPVLILTNLSENSAIYESVALNANAYYIKSNSSLEHITNEVITILQPAK